MEMTLRRSNLATGATQTIPCELVGCPCDRCHAVREMGALRRWRDGWVCLDRATCARRVLANTCPGNGMTGEEVPMRRAG